ncbi:MAG: hypothetical protein ABFR05_03120 [Bacteroidota bacterium]
MVSETRWTELPFFTPCTTTILLENNVPLEQASKWLGHANNSSTQVYGKITKSRLDTTASRINDLY